MTGEHNVTCAEVGETLGFVHVEARVAGGVYPQVVTMRNPMLGATLREALALSPAANDPVNLR